MHITPLTADDVRAGPDLLIPATGVLGFAAGPQEFALLITRAPDLLLIVRIGKSGAPVKQTSLIAGGDHAVIGTEWFGEFALTGRLVRTATGYAAYSAVHRRWPDGIGHQGDQLREVRDDDQVDVSWTWGCSHSGSQRLFWSTSGPASAPASRDLKLRRRSPSLRSRAP